MTQKVGNINNEPYASTCSVTCCHCCLSNLFKNTIKRDDQYHEKMLLYNQIDGGRCCARNNCFSTDTYSSSSPSSTTNPYHYDSFQCVRKLSALWLLALLLARMLYFCAPNLYIRSLRQFIRLDGEFSPDSTANYQQRVSDYNTFGDLFLFYFDTWVLLSSTLYFILVGLLRTTKYVRFVVARKNSQYIVISSSNNKIDEQLLEWYDDQYRCMRLFWWTRTCYYFALVSSITLAITWWTPLLFGFIHVFDQSASYIWLNLCTNFVPCSLMCCDFMSNEIRILFSELFLPNIVFLFYTVLYLLHNLSEFVYNEAGYNSLYYYVNWNGGDGYYAFGVFCYLHFLMFFTFLIAAWCKFEWMKEFFQKDELPVVNVESVPLKVDTNVGVNESERRRDQEELAKCKKEVERLKGTISQMQKANVAHNKKVFDRLQRCNQFVGCRSKSKYVYDPQKQEMVVVV